MTKQDTLKQKKINIIYGVIIGALIVYSSVMTLLFVEYSKAFDASVWLGIQNDIDLRTEFGQRIEKLEGKVK